MINQKRSSLQKGNSGTPQMYLNTGTMYDLAVGDFVQGENGSMILNGGISRITSVVGKEQTFKTAISGGYFGRILRNYPYLEGLYYDTENSTNQEERLAVIGGCRDEVDTADFISRVEYRNLDSYYLEDFYDRIMDIAADREKHRSDYIEETPFLDRYGKPILAWVPFVILCDSFSAALTSVVEKLIDKEGIAGKKTTTDNMKDGLIKTRFFSRMPAVASRAGLALIFTGHMGKSGGMSPVDQFDKKLPFLKMNEKPKNVGSKFTYLSNNLMETRNVSVLKDSKKECEYPSAVNSAVELQLIKSIICRGKNNASGSTVYHISSQFYGLQEHLEYFHYVRERGELFGSRGRYRFPSLDVKFTRKEVREVLDTKYEYRRMTELLGQYLYIYRNWNLPKLKLMKPEVLVELMDKTDSALMNDILNSTGIWNFKNAVSSGDREYMSVIDITDRLMKEHNIT